MEDKERTLYCGNLSDKVTEDILYELFLQAGPLENVSIPKDKDGRRRNFSFITFKHAVSVPYSVALMNGVTLFGRALRLDARTGAESEHNPYLETLNAHKRSFSYPEKNDSRGYGYDRRDSFRNDRYSSESSRVRSVAVPLVPNYPHYSQNPAYLVPNVALDTELQRTPYRNSSYRSRVEQTLSPWRRHTYY